MNQVSKVIVTLSFLFFLYTNPIYSQAFGSLKGVVADSENGEKIISAVVYVKNTNKGANTKHDGSFLIKDIPVGTYDIEVSYIGYEKFVLSQVKVTSKEIKNLEIKMKSKAVSTGEVVVTAKAIKESNTILLKDRKEAVSFSDAIGSDDISKSGGSDASDAVKKVTGATIVGGKHVYIRGLGDRYAKTQLNGASLPSADPDKRSVHLDMFSSGIIENITMIKTATPDRPGDFTGGAVDIKTKSYPDKFFTNLTFSTAYNTQVTGNNVLLGNRGRLDWLGFDDGSREIPNQIQNVISSNGGIPNGKSIYSLERHLDDAQRLVSLTKSFDSKITPDNYIAPVNQNLSFSIGNKYLINKSPIGFLASFNYEQSFENYTNGIYGRYNLLGVNNEDLFPSYITKEAKGQHNVYLGGFVNLSYEIVKDNEIGLNLMYNNAAENLGISQNGYYNGSAIPNRGFQTYASKFTERNLFTTQIKGKHLISSLNNSKIDWNLSFSENNISSPDIKFFAFDYKTNGSSNLNNLAPDPINPEYTINKSAYNEPARIFRDMLENVTNFNLNYELPLDNFIGYDLKIKLGTSLNYTNRDFKEEWFVYNSSSNQIKDVDVNGNQYDFDPNTLLDKMTGIIENGKFIEMPIYLSYFSPENYSYNATMDVSAFYGMVDFKLFDNLRVITGIRSEISKLKALPYDLTKIKNYEEEYKEINNIDSDEDVNISFDDFGINENDLLPSVNTIYTINQNSNLRLAYSKTLARPNLREIAPYSSFDFVGGFLYLGNPFLKRSLINNYDLRYEVFPNLGEVIAGSVFYKEISNPIELSQPTVNDQVRFQNSQSGKILGMELEFRKTLKNTIEMFSFKAPNWTEYFTYSLNLTLTKSEVKIPDGREKNNILLTNPKAKLTREFLGQSPYVVNFDLAYSNFDLGTNINLNFNVFGKRLSTVMFGITPDIYENPRPDLNLIVSQSIFESWTIKFSAKNILNSYTIFAQEHNKLSYATQKYLTGRQFSLSLSYKFN